jgi:putative transposase
VLHPVPGQHGNSPSDHRSQSTLQNPFVERVIGSIRRECLDHYLILNEAHLRRLLRGYIAYYNTARPHQSLDHNSPQPREVHPPELGRVVSIPQVGGLHHLYQRAA